jgi:hypothetical protein
MDSDLEYIYEQYVESSDGTSDDEEYSDETAMMHAVLEDAEPTEEHVLKFQGLDQGSSSANRNRARNHLTLMADYFAPDALFADHFRRRFRMRKTVFDRLYHGVRSYDDYVVLKKDVVGTIDFSGYQKCTAALRMLAYATPADSWDEYLRMSESTCRDVMVGFAIAVVDVFGLQYLR